METIFAIIVLIVMSCVSLGLGQTIDNDFVRDKVIIHCVKHLDACKEEYNFLQNKEALNNYKRPEIENLK